METETLSRSLYYRCYRRCCRPRSHLERPKRAPADWSGLGGELERRIGAVEQPWSRRTTCQGIAADCADWHGFLCDCVHTAIYQSHQVHQAHQENQRPIHERTGRSPTSGRGPW